MAAEVPHSTSSLEEAVARAVREGLAEAQALERSVAGSAQLLRQVAARVRPWCQRPEDEEDPFVAFGQIAHAGGSDLEDLFARQRKVLSTFNIAFFGRTGAGKSSLLTAMGELDGERVSRGESDWTTVVEPVPWRGCLLYDTPGINGWGRTRSRAELEEAARRAVEVADVVILCFDTQSQQASEFEKIAAWVIEYSKPVIAVLNSRNPRWRMPARVATRSARRTLSQPLREHAQNIADELARIGISNPPVVAISSQRAVFARAGAPYKGPQEQVLEKLRKEYGQARLLAWSHVDALQELLAAAVSTGAVDLRVNALREGVRSSVERWRMDMAQVRGLAEGGCVPAERLVQTALGVLGYPDQDRARFSDPRAKTDLLTLSERLRGEPYRTPANGELGQHLKHLLTSHLSKLRTQSLAAAEELVVSAFEDGRQVSEQAFSSAVFDGQAVASVGERVMKEAMGFVQRRLKLATEDAQADLNFLARSGTSLDGRKGTALRYTGNALRVGGLLAGAGATLGALALANFWNPLGWGAGVAAAVSLGGGIAAALFGWIGSKSRKKAEEQRVRARADAIAKARGSVHDCYDAFETGLAAQASELAWQQASPAIAEVLVASAGLRSLAAELNRLDAALSKQQKAITASRTTAAQVLASAQGAVERCRWPNTRSARHLWLGEDWVNDPEGLSGDEDAADPARTTSYDPGFLESLANSLGDAFRTITAHPTRSAAASWLAEVKQAGQSDADLAAVAAAASVRLSNPRPAIYLCGDYSAGKSSFIKRLLLDSGAALPDGLSVRGDPTTATVTEYGWEGVTLVDTPGFQSGRGEHDQRSLEVVSEASMGLMLFHTNLLLGDPTAIDTILKGAGSVIPKLSRTMFIVNRCDELGIDPAEAPREHARLAASKRAELALALKSRAIEVDSSRIFTMASDPYGLVGDRRDVSSASFDAFRDWDGFRPFLKAFRDNRASLMSVGSAVSVLEGGMGALLRHEEVLGQELSRIAILLNAHSRLRSLIQAALRDAEVLEGSIRGRAANIVSDSANAALQAVLGARNEDEINAEAKRLSTWWTGSEFVSEVARFQKRAATDIDSWFSSHSGAIEREVRSSVFRAAHPELGEAFDAADLAKEKGGGLARLVKLFGDGLGGATRDVVYQIGKALGHNFIPWGAVNLSAKLIKVGGVLAPIGLALDVISFVREFRHESKREEARLRVVRWIKDTIPIVTSQLTSDQVGGSGPVAYLSAQASNFRALEIDLSGDVASLSAAQEQLAGRLAVSARLRASARRHLGQSNAKMEAGR